MAETNPAERLPEAFTNQDAQEAEPLKEVYNATPDMKGNQTSTGMNVADEASAESFPGSDPPATMASGGAPTDSPPSNAG